jgi:death on curing protein
VTKRPGEPRWLSRVVVDAIHTEQIREHGGLSEVRDETALESALARPQQKWHYAQKVDVPSLAAVYGVGLVKNRPYRDGNKRIGFLSIVTFLGINGHDLDATDAEVISEMLALADGRVSEDELAEWIRQHSGKRR